MHSGAAANSRAFLAGWLFFGGQQFCRPETGELRVPLGPGSPSSILLKERGVEMDTTTIIRIVAGVLVVVILAVLIQRRRTRVK
jgi:hypothetical protein